MPGNFTLNCDKNEIFPKQSVLWPVSRKPRKFYGPVRVKPYQNLEPYDYRAVLFPYSSCVFGANSGAFEKTGDWPGANNSNWDVFALQPGLRIGSDCCLLPGDVILRETPGFPNGFIPLSFDSRTVHH